MVRNGTPRENSLRAVCRGIGPTEASLSKPEGESSYSESGYPGTGSLHSDCWVPCISPVTDSRGDTLSASQC
eukprot:583713-Rhodomonas_salina.1